MKEEFRSRIKDLEDIKKVFDKYGIKLFMTYGALLGFYRDGKFLPGDDDIDLSVIEPLDFKTKKDIGWDLLNIGFKPQEIFFNVFGRMEKSEAGYNGDDDTGIIVCERDFKFTIFFFKEEQCDLHGKEYVCTPKKGSYKLISTPARFFEKESKIKISRNYYLTPSPIKDYLAYSYYNNWKDKKDRRHSPLYTDVHPEYLKEMQKDGNKTNM